MYLRLETARGSLSTRPRWCSKTDVAPRRPPRKRAAESSHKHRSPRVASELGVDVAAAEVVDDRHVVARITEMQGGGAAAEAVAAQHDDFCALGADDDRVPSGE